MGNRPEYVVAKDSEEWMLKIWAQPGAKRSEPAGEYQGRLKCKIAAPAVDNKANKELVKFIARLLGLKPGAIRLDSGHTGRKKNLLITCGQEPAWDILSGRRP